MGCRVLGAARFSFGPFPPLLVEVSPGAGAARACADLHPQEPAVFSEPPWTPFPTFSFLFFFLRLFAVCPNVK